jgi:hypothetical protein
MTDGVTKWTTWALRPIVLFAATYMIVGIIHELTHALVAYAFHIPSTLFHFAANIDRTHGTLNQHTIVSVAGPLVALVIGLLSARIAESSFWIAAAVGTLVSRKLPTHSQPRLNLGWADIALLLTAALLVRLLAGGITLSP